MSGLIDGGLQVTNDTLDYSAVTAAVTTKIGTNFTNIETVTGDGVNDTLVGADAANTWSITGVNAGTVGGVAFNGFSNLTGGTLNDGFTLSGGTLGGALNGGTGTNTLTGDNVANTWTITGADAGTVTGISGGFTNIANLIGGTGTDSFTLSGGTLSGAIDGGLTGINTLTADNVANSWTISGADAGTVTGITGGFTNISTLVGGNTTDSFAFTPGGVLSGPLDGGLGSDTLDFSSYGTAVSASPTGTGSGNVSGTPDPITYAVGDDYTGIESLNTGAGGGLAGPNGQTNTWDITGVDQFTLNGTTFSGVSTVLGGDQIDTFTIEDGGQLTGATAIDGSTGANSIISVGNATWTLTGADAGSIATTAGATSFVNIQTLTGGAGNDSFILNGGTLSGAINGGLGVNSLTADNLANTWVINAADGGSVTGITGGFTNIANLVGGTGTDSFTLSGGTLSGAIDGGTGTNTLTGDNVANTWTISGADTGTVTGITGTFSNIANLTGGSNDDAFTIGASGSVSGLIDGGLQVTNDTLDYSAVTAAVTTKVGTNFTNIETVTGDGVNDTLVGADAANTWSITGVNAGTVGGVAFNGFSNLTGGTLNDGFTLSGGTLGGALNGGTGTNTLTGDNVANTWTITGADAGTVTGISGGFTNIANLIGGTGTDSFTLSGGTLSGAIDGGLTGINTLTADNVANSWTISGADAGTVTGITGGFTNISTLVGGNTTDSFAFTPGGVLSGPLDGGLGSDTLDFSSYGTAVSASPTGTGSGNVSGTPDPITYAVGDDYTGIESLNTGAGGGLAGPNGQTNTWDITGVDQFTLNGTTFSGVSTVLGGDQIDTFTIEDGGQLTGATAIDGSTGANSIISVGNATWTLTGADAGSIATTAGATSFVNIQTLTGGAGNDSFILNGGTLSGAINGGLGVNSLTADNLANTWVINAADGGSVTGITGGFTNIANLIGGTGTDSFTLSGGTLSGALDGGTGTNTLTGDNVANTWTITALDGGTVTGITGGFTNIANLTGGTGTDSFTLSGGTLSGAINGGLGVNTLTADNLANTWVINAADGGSVTGITGGFTNIGNLTGGTGTDSFTLSGGILSGSIDGGLTGANTLTADNVANTWTVTGPDAGSVTGLTGGFANVGNLIGGTLNDSFTLSGGTLSGSIDGGTGTNSLAGDNVANSWVVNAADGGTVTGITGNFTNIGTLIGGSNADTFTFNPGGVLSGPIDGGLGSDTLDFLSYGTTVSASPTVTGSGNVSGTPDPIAYAAGDDYVGMETVLATGGLSAPNGQTNVWDITGVDQFTLNGTTFSGVSTVVGGDQIDTFTIQDGGQLTGATAIDGGLGANSIISVGNATWTLTGADAGSIATTAGATSFVNIQTLTGGAGIDNFTLAGGTLSGSIDGGLTGVNTLTADNVANTWVLTGADAGTVTGITGGFSNIGNLVGGTGTDSFILSGGTLSGSIDGGLTGANTLTADNVANTWTISGADAGSVTGITGGFSNIANLTGGSNDDAFSVGASGSVSGLIDGGLQVTSDTLSYAAVTAAVTTKIDTNFTNIESVTGDGLNDTLVGADAANTWTVTGLNAGTVGGVAFSGFSNLTGGTLNDAFTISGGSLGGALDGGTGTNTLTGDNVANTWTITALDGGTVTGITGGFTNIANLTGGTGTDSFTLSGGTLSGAINGGLGVNTLTADNLANTWVINAADGGSVTGITGGFTNIGNLTGGTGTDSFTLSGGILSGSIDGGLTGANTLTADNVANTWTVTGPDAGSVTGLTGGFANVGNLIGGTLNDSFTLSGGTLSGSIDGGTGTNSLAGDNVANSWVVNAADGGTVTGITGNFTNIGTLIGGSNADTFTFNPGGVLSGPIDGGLGSDTLDFLSYGTTVSASPTVTGSGNVSGTPDPIAYAAGDDYVGMETVLATGGLSAPNGQTNVWDITGVDQFTLNGTTFSGVSTVVGGDQIDTFTIQDGGQLTGATAIDGGLGANSIISVGNATWTLTGADAGSIATTAGATSFVNIQTLTGGAGIDNFTLAGGTLSGSIDGGLTGVNTLTADNVANTWVLTGADAGTVTGITGGFSNIGNLVGGTGTDSFILSGGTLSGSIDGGLTGANTLTADNVANTWTISGADAGSVTGITGGFSNIANLTGGSNDDAFSVGASGSVSGLIDGGLQVTSDTLSYAAVTAAVTTKIDTNFTNIESVTGDGLNDTLVGADAANTWTVTGLNAGTVGGVAFSGFSNLTGGTLNDAFTISGGSLGGALDGGTGTNTLTGDNVANTWTITALDGGTVTGITGGFTNIANLTGGTGTDSFTLSGGTLSGAINGGLGVNTLTADNLANTWVINAADGGSVTGITGGFTNIGNLTGGTGTDSFTLSGGILSGSIDGGLTGANTLTADNVANTWTVTGPDAGTVTGLTGGFANIGNLIGGTLNDSFTLSGGTLIGVLDGGAGTNSLTGDNVANNWVINAADGGTVTGLTGGFTNIGILIGGNNTDYFTFNPGGVLSGPIDGGLGSDTLDFLSYGTPVSANPTVTGSGNVSGTPDPITYATGDDYVGMETVLATGGLSAPNGQTNVWDITGVDQFTLNGTTYSGMTAVVGGDQVDTFTIQDGGQLTGATAIDGGLGANSIISVGNATWTLTGADAGSITTTAGATTFVNIQTLTGGAGNDSFVLSGGTLSGVIDGGLGINSLTGDNVANSWVVTGSRTGTVTGITLGYSNIDNLIGGGSTDNFVISDGTVTSGSIDGGAGMDTLDLSGYTTARSVVLMASGVNGFGGTEASIGGGFANIDVVTAPATTVNTLQSQDLVNIWTISGTNSGTLDTGGNVLAFSAFNNLTGGALSDGFTLAGGVLSGTLNGGLGSNTLTADNVANTWVITAVDAGTVTGITGGFTNIGNLNGGTATDSFTLSGGTLSGAIDGGLTAVNTLTADNVANTWTISGADAGSVTGISGGFVNIGNLTGGTGTDSFILSGGTLSGAIDGGLTAVNTLTADNVANTWTISGADAGSVTGISGGFVNIGNLTGGTGTDSFILSGGTLSGAINGGLTGVNTLTADNVANTWTISGVDAGSVTGITGGFTNIANLNGGTGTDSFTLAGGSLSGVIDGGLTGANTLIGGNVANTWTISGSDAGTVTGISGGFTNIGTLVGGNLNDGFIFTPGGILSGPIDGSLGNDTLDFTSYGTAVSASPTGTGSGKVSGTPDPITYAGTSDYTNMENVVGVGVAGPNGQTNIWDVTGVDQFTLNGTTFSGVTTVTGGDQVDTFIMEDAGLLTGQIDGGLGSNDIQSVGNATWSLTGADAGSITTTAGVTTFVNIQALTGGAGSDSFTLAGGTLSGALDGGTGTNSLTGDNVANTWVLTGADAGTVTGITGGFSNIGNLVGGTGTDSFILSGGTLSGSIDGGLTGANTLTADNVANTWTISGADAGSVTGITGGFSNIANLTGGSNDDAFSVGASGSVSGLIDGGLQVTSDTLSYAAVTAAVTTKIDTNFTNIESVTGDGLNDTLVGADAANTWTVTGLNAGTVGGVAFSGFSNLTGGTLNDAFTISGGSLGGALDGGTGTNTLTGDNVASTWTITALDGGTVTGITGGFTNIANLTGGTGTDSFTLSGGTLSGAIDGGLTGANILTGDNVATTWVITAADAGTVTGITGGFTNIGNLTGGTGTDSFTLSGGTLSGSIDGGLTGANTLTADNVATTWMISGADAGSVTGLTGGFTNVGNLIGGTLNDSFTLSGGSLSGVLDGGTGTNTLTGDNVVNTWTITAADAGAVTGITGGFINIANLLGGTGTDSFTLSGGTVSGTLDGGLIGANTLTADNVANTWVITGADAGTVTGITGGFTNIGNLIGGTGTDSFTLSGGTLSGAIDGGVTGINTLTADNVANTWVIIAADAGTVTGITGGFTNIANLIGGNTNDSFTLAGGTLSGTLDGGAGGTNTLVGADVANTWTITGADAGTVTGISGGFSNIGTLVGGNLNDGFTFTPGGILSGPIDGGLGNDTLDFTSYGTPVTASPTGTGSGKVSGTPDPITYAGTSDYTNMENVVGVAVVGPNGQTNVWDVTGVDQFTLNGTTFSGVTTVTGGDQVDTFIMEDAGLLTGQIDGGLGSNDIQSVGNATWSLTGADAGSITTTAGVTTFVNIQALTGGAGSDSFTLAGGTLSGALDGGTGPNSLTGDNVATTWTITGVDAGTVTGVSGGFTNIGTLIGGTNTDSFTLSGGTLSGSIDGGLTGVNSLTADNVANTWTISGADAGSVTGVAVGFTHIANLTGGSNDDAFSVGASGSVSGLIDGGAQVGSDTLDYSAVTAAVTTKIDTNFTNIESVTGDGINDTLVGADVANTWTISGANAGTVGGVAFNGFSNLTGGTNNDDFTISGGTLSGALDGGAGPNSLTGDNVATTWTITGVDAGTVTGVSGGFTNIGTLIGGTNTDSFTLSGGTLSGSIDGGLTGVNSLTADNVANTWTISGADAGSVTGVAVGFTHIANLTGGSNDDAFSVGASGSVSGLIDGGAQVGSDTLDYSAVTAAVTTKIDTNFTNIESVTGDGINDTLVGADVANTWTISGANAGTVGGVAFNGFSNLTGGTNNDDFTISGGTLSGALDGGAGPNSLTGDNVATTWTITGVDAGTVTGVSGGFTNIGTLIGGTNTDSFTLSGGTLSGSIDGGLTGVNSLTADNVANTWTISGADAGSVTGVAVGFTHIANLTGGSNDDAFSVGASGSVSGLIDGGAQVGSDTLDYSAVTAAVTTKIDTNFTNIESVAGDGINDTLVGADVANTWTISGANAGTVGGVAFNGFSNLTGGTNNDDFTISGGTLSGALDGGAGPNSLTGDNVATTWTITGVDAGTVTGVSGGFTNIGTLIGGTNTDSFTLSGGTLSGSIDGGLTGVNSLTADNVANTWTISGADAGTVTGITGGFTNIVNLTGGTNSDDFTLAGGTLSGALDGNAGTNTLTGDNVANTWMISAADGGSVTGISGGFINIANLVGGSASDDFLITTGTLSGMIDGGAGINSLTGADVSNAWTITGADAGGVTGIGGGFTNVGTLIGGSGADNFSFFGTAVLSGPVDGGLGNDTIDFSGYSTPVSISPTGTGSGNAMAVPDPIAYAAGDDYTGMETVIATGSLIGPNGQDNFWDITGHNQFTLNGTTYIGMTSILGGDQADTFTIENLGLITGSPAIDGGPGANVLQSVAGATWELTASDAGNITTSAGVTSFINIQTLSGGAGNDGFILNGGTLSGAIDGGLGTNSLTADNVANVWNITGPDSGIVTGVGGGFTNIANLVGGSATDGFTLAGGSLSGTVNGGGGTNALTGDNVANIWTITGPDAGSVTGIGGGFSNIGNLNGGTDTDSFTLSGGTLSGAIDGGLTGVNTLTADNVANVWTITGADAGTVTGIAGGFSNIGNLNGGTDTDSLTLSGGTLSGAIDGGLTGANTLTADNVANVWTITGADAGTVTGIAGGFSNIGNLNGGTDTDSFTLSGGTLSGAIDGGLTGANTLTADNVANVWTITGADSGTVTGIASGFTNIGNLVGGSDVDAFTLAGGTLSGTLDGGLGSNTLTADNVSNTWTITGADAGSVTGIAGGFTNVGNLVGGTSSDDYTLAGGTLSGTVDGGLGLNSLTADNVANTWVITGSRSGTVTGIGVGYSNIDNLFGGSLTDSFAINDTVVTSGSIDGGAGVDTLDLSAYTTDRSVVLTASGVNGFNGTEASVGGGFFNIDVVTLPVTTVNTLQAQDLPNVWTISGADSGTLDTGGNVLSFNGVNNLIGGSDVDAFILAGGTLSGTVDGGLGSNTLTGDSVANTWTITGVDAGSVTGIGGGFTYIANLVGGSDVDAFTLVGGTLSGTLDGGLGSNTLTGDSVANIWTITGVDAGSVTGIGGGFTNVGNLVGGTLSDDYTLAGGTLSGTVDGGAGLNSLTADNVANAWVITGSRSGTVTGIGVGYSNIDNLFGGTDTDSFTINDTVVTSGSIDGGAGVDTLDLSVYTTDRSVVLTASGVNGFNGTEASVGGGFANIDVVTGPATTVNTLQAQDLVNAWTITGLDSGALDTAGNVLAFNGFNNLIGGSATDTFTFSGSAVLNGQVDGGSGDDSFIIMDSAVVNGQVIGGAGSDTLDFLGYSVPVSISPTGMGSGDAIAIPDPITNAGGDDYTGIEIVMASGSLIGPNGQDNNWDITGVNQITFQATTFIGLDSIVGGDQIDTFIMEDGGQLTGTTGIDGGPGNNVIQSVGNATWTITGGADGDIATTAGATTFTRVQDLSGGSGNDNFVVADTVVFTGSIDGGTAATR